ncbi:hypothetical protein CANINC_002470 [Pichia inconspicua]|uniref:Uncharacterized protein n=1 Tax=Pichia inconspicua TaxID=52247 RepID=A0A4T0X141_9ASCO|nr:hypothetical protein CANINC_002470 [[Candida] inconspicua]
MIFSKPFIYIDLDKESNFKYTPQTPIQGRIKIEVNKKLKDVSAIVCGLHGQASIVDTLSNKALTDQVKRIVKEGSFVNIVKNIPFDKNHTLDKNTKIETDFIFEIIPQCYFPSSNYCTFDKNYAIKVWYEVYVEIYRFDKHGKPQKLYIDYSKIVEVQGNQDPRVVKDVEFTPYTQSNTFIDKLKKFYYDSTLSALIPTSMSSNHSKTKFVRKLWNDNYKPEKYTLYTKTIPLTVIFSAPTSFDMSKPVYTQLKLDFQCDLLSVGIESNQTTDFVFNNQSTGLGIFQIESLKIHQEIKRVVTQGELSATHDDSKLLLHVHFENLIFDVKDFQYNKELETYIYSLNSEQLKTEGITQPLVEILNGTIVTTGEIRIIDQTDVSSFTEVPINYTTLSNLEFRWKISDGGSQCQKYNFETKCTPDFINNSL